MTALQLEGQSWTFQNQTVLSTRDIITRLLSESLDHSLLCGNSDDPEWRTLRERFKFFGPYLVLRKLGEGAFGVVYQGVHAKRYIAGQPCRLVALKTPTPALLDRFASAAMKEGSAPKSSELKTEEERRYWARGQLGQMFSREAALTARFAQCPNVVNVIDHDTTVPFLALEFCDDGSLEDRLKKPYSEEDLLSWGRQICMALKVAHNLDPAVIHRDLKPENILIHDGVLKLSDLGTSQLLQQTSSLRSLKGGYTPTYAAPEAFDGRAVVATDIWSLGVMLFEMVSGRPPYTGDSMVSLMKAIATDEVPELVATKGLQLPQELLDFITQDCLAKEPAERPSAGDCLEFFEALIEGQDQPFQEKRPRPMKSVGQRPKKGGGLVLIAAAMVSILLIGTAALLFQNQAQLEKKSEKRSRVEAPKKIEKVKEKEKPRTWSRGEIQEVLNDRLKWQDSKNEPLLRAALQFVQKTLGQDYELIEVSGQPLKRYSCGFVTHSIAAFKHVHSGLVLHLIPGGTFRMGSEYGSENEKPVRDVTIKAFLIGRHEVRQSAWDRVGGMDSRTFRGPDLPIERVSWVAVQNWLKQAGGGLRLPSESEWEYACRGGAVSEYYWGEEMDGSYCWYKENCSEVGQLKTRKVTLHYFSRKWNGFGLVDMNGNVWEWCQDHWFDNYEKGPVDGSPRRGNRVYRVDRGGGYSDIQKSCRPANRSKDYTSYQGNIGFRVAKSID